MRAFAIVAACALLCVCATASSEVLASELGSLQRGVTTRAQVLASFGAPTTSTLLPGGKRLDMYVYSHATVRPASFIPAVGAFAGGTDVRSESVMLTYDASSILLDYSPTTTQMRSTTGMVATGQPETPQRGGPQ